jgi:deazaflavin-dependent oxidoreductase (nitroreductase family)
VVRDEMAGEAVVDNPADWVARHIREYVESDGEQGHRWQGVNTLLLTTRGHKSGTLRRTALIYGEDEDRYVVVASKGGAPAHPSWYRNLAANPDVLVQVAADKFRGRARTASGEERTRLWELMASIWPEYNRYQERTDREIPVVVIERA